MQNMIKSWSCLPADLCEKGIFLSNANVTCLAKCIQRRVDEFRRWTFWSVHCGRGAVEGFSSCFSRFGQSSERNTCVYRQPDLIISLLLFCTHWMQVLEEHLVRAMWHTLTHRHTYKHSHSVCMLITLAVFQLQLSSLTPANSKHNWYKTSMCGEVGFVHVTVRLCNSLFEVHHVAF